MKDLPPAVQKAVQDETKIAELKGLSKETTNGKTVYEVETVANGKTRDLVIDSKGAVIEVELEATLDTIPEAAKAGILKKVGTGKVKKVETLTKGGVTNYEASYTKGGKSLAVLVEADGTPTKD